MFRDKKESDQTPLQDEKADIVNEIIAEKEEEKEIKAGVKPGSKRGAYNKTKKKKPARRITKTADPEIIYTDSQAENDAAFITSLINEIRTGAGIPKIRESHERFFNPSAKAMFLKYGSTTSKWMPEIMFGGTLAFIMLDTYKELQILKEKQKQKPDKKIDKDEKKPDLKEFEKL